MPQAVSCSYDGTLLIVLPCCAPTTTPTAASASTTSAICTLSLVPRSLCAPSPCTQHVKWLDLCVIEAFVLSDGNGIISVTVGLCKMAQLAHHDLGGTGPTVILLHANSLCGRVYQPLAYAGLTQHFHCIAIDAPGQGTSPRRSTAQPITEDRLAQCVYDKIQALGQEGVWSTHMQARQASDASPVCVYPHNGMLMPVCILCVWPDDVGVKHKQLLPVRWCFY